MQTWLMNKAAYPPTVRQESDNMLNLLDIDFWLWYQKVTPKGMDHAFKIKFWETFSTPRYYDILTNSQYKMTNSNDGCMQLRAPTACPKWNEGTDEDTKVLQWLSVNTGLTSECVSEVIEPFAKWQAENATTGMTWNEAAKHAAERQVMQPLLHPATVVELNTASSSGDEPECRSQHVSNSNSTSVKHLLLLPSPTASSQPTLPCSIHHLSSIIHHQWQLPISSLLNYHHLDFPDIQ